MSSVKKQRRLSDGAQVDRLGSEVAWRHADQILVELEPDVALIRVCMLGLLLPLIIA